MNFLFRRPPGGHVFMTTQDPTYVYTVLCGRCEYPIEANDERCPRCQVELEDCPVCRDATHKRARRVEHDPQTGRKVCPVCDTQRIPFGGQPLTEVTGSFCRNVYGCQAGGLLLRSEEFAVLRPDASLCPICKHPELTPLDVRIFLYLISRCLFCNSVFGPLPTWSRGWTKDWEPSLASLREVGPNDGTSCLLCGRRDRLTGGSSDAVVVLEAGPLGELTERTIPAVHYLRMAELGRILVLEKDPTRAFHKLFSAWFEPSRTVVPEVSVPVGEVSRLLLEGTLEPPIQRVLRVRVEDMLRSWGQRLPSGGLEYPVTARDGQRWKKH